MAITLDKAIQAGEKVRATLVNQGRNATDSTRDAQAWVLGNYGITIALSTPEPEPHIWTSWQTTRRQGRNWSADFKTAQKRKRSNAAKKAAATKKFNKARQAYFASEISWQAMDRAHEVYMNRLREIRNS